MMIKRILVGLGGTPFTTVAIRRAVELARLHAAEVTGVTVIDAAQLAHVGAVPIGAMEAGLDLSEYRLEEGQHRIEEALAEFQSVCSDNLVEHETIRETEDPFSTMVSLARYHDLSVFGLRSIFDCGFGVEPPNVLAQLIGRNVRPVIACSDVYRPVRKALIAYSGSTESAKAMKRFVQMRLWPEMELRLITCGGSAEDADRLLCDAATYCRAHGYEPDTMHLPGPPHRSILEHAEFWDADLVVLGNSFRNFIRRKIFGETVLSVIQESDRPLFLSH